jgi:uncharacterized protein (TIGR03435 family)
MITIMKRLSLVVAALGFIISVPCRAQPQTATTPLTFEVASVKPSGSGSNGYSGGCHGIDSKYGPSRVDAAPPLGRCVIHDARLSHLVFMAFGLPSMQALKSGSDWVAIGAERFDVEAKAEDPAKTTEDQLLQMLQALLVDRFKMKFHRETKEAQGFALVVAKNRPKLQEDKDETVESRLTGSTKANPPMVNARRYSMAMLADLLSQVGQGPVADETGLKSFYDFKLTWDDANGPSIFTALTEQLGLKFESRKVPLSIFVVDAAQRPTQN